MYVFDLEIAENGYVFFNEPLEVARPTYQFCSYGHVASAAGDNTPPATASSYCFSAVSTEFWDERGRIMGLSIAKTVCPEFHPSTKTMDCTATVRIMKT